MATWPGSLPSAPLYDGYQETSPEVALRTQMDTGPAKVRRRFTAGFRPLSLTFLLTKAQVATLDDFFQSTVEGGAVPFTFAHPRTGATVTCRFLSPPKYTAAANDVWRAACAMEIVP